MKAPLGLGVLGLYCLGSLNIVPDSLGTELPSYQAGFEEADSFVSGSIEGQAGWSLDQGVVDVVPGSGRNGTSGLAIPGSELFGQASLVTARPSATGLEPGQTGNAPRVTFLDMWVRVPAAEWLSFDESIDIDSARVGLFRNSLFPELAQWHVFHGDGLGGGTWINTGQTAFVNSGSAENPTWTRLTIRQDLDHQNWDIWADGTLLSHALGFQFPPSAEAVEVFVLGHATAPTYLDDLSISAYNPLGADTDADGVLDSAESTPPPPPTPEAAEADRADTDADGLPDAWELAHGLDPSNPADAQSDQDRDGLNAFDEFALGTDPEGKDLVRQEASAGAAVFSRFVGTSARRAKSTGP